jgi:hypothetical protein
MGSYASMSRIEFALLQYLIFLEVVSKFNVFRLMYVVIRIANLFDYDHDV